ncbi:MAG: AbrB/MazE/SpoVT family DNA-binding domain-containing protein, partial [Methyloglobulus sp.]|nr:AbrB/MazE/SpoVT family DNA-binding domain-containing protein [Methyloglobulus sp.]
ITPYDSEFERQMTVAKEVMKKRRNVLRELAK